MLCTSSSAHGHRIHSDRVAIYPYQLDSVEPIIKAIQYRFKIVRAHAVADYPDIIFNRGNVIACYLIVDKVNEATLISCGHMMYMQVVSYGFENHVACIIQGNIVETVAAYVIMAVASKTWRTFGTGPGS